MEIAVLLIAVLAAFCVDSGPQITGYLTMSVSIKFPSEAVLLESATNKTTFNFSFANDSAFYEYYGDFTLTNNGQDTIDVFISAGDMESLNGSAYINVARDSGDLQLFLPSLGWYSIPDNSDTDSDGSKDGVQLCISNDMPASNETYDYNFRVRSSVSETPFFLNIRVLTVKTGNKDVCTATGDYYAL